MKAIKKFPSKEKLVKRFVKGGYNVHDAEVMVSKWYDYVKNTYGSDVSIGFICDVIGSLSYQN